MNKIKQSSVIPFVHRSNDLKVMLVTSRTDGLWIIPKGHLEPDMTPAESAEEEAFEEAGVTGALFHENVYTYTFPRFGRLYEVGVYLLEVDEILDDWEESSFRDRQLVSLKKAMKLVQYDHLKEDAEKPAEVYSSSEERFQGMTFDEFTDSAERDNGPPAGCSEILKSLWYAQNGNWEMSHNIAQDIHNTDGSWVHAYLHREEGDLGNARYWYNRADRPESKASVEEERAEMIRHFIDLEYPIRRKE